ncbi:DUF732 domain-containing protein [Mycobacterium sp. 2YAF39]|uniref:DUF732 domain-containing protein n=1 Tax=Mycobacterium sp. 2YAF39 TaxID=3233033 RepID=UPI003F9E17C6
MTAALSAGGVVAVMAVSHAGAAAAQNDASGYVGALERAELIVPSGDPKYQFTDGDSALFTGNWVCQEVQQGRSRYSIVDDLDHSDGMLLSPSDAGVIFDAATSYLC